MKKDLDYLISVVVPLSNDGYILSDFCSELFDVLSSRYANFEIVLVDYGLLDNAQPGVSQILKNVDCIRYLRLSRPADREVAITAGFETAIGDFIVVMLPEFDPVLLVPEMIERSRLTGALVLGRVPDGLYHGIYEKLHTAFIWICDKFFGIHLIPNTTYFMVLTRQTLNSVNQIRDKFRYVKTLSHQLGIQTEIVDYEFVKRQEISWGRSFYESLNLGIDLIVSNSVRPLRYVSLLGLLVSGVYFLYFGYIALVALFKNDVAEGWITLSVQNALAFFTLNIVLATVCEYIGRILIESKDRPFYFIVEEKNSSVMIVNQSSKINVVEFSEKHGQT